jgi:hypothetical protein
MSEARLAGLVAVRIAWITAILVCAVGILIGLFSGTDGGYPSQQLPGFAFSEGRDSSQRLPDFASFDPAAAMVGAAAQEDRSGRAKEGASGGSHSRSGLPPGSGSRPEDTGGRTPAVTPRPKPPQASEGDPAPVIPPKPPNEPSVAPPKPPKEPSLAPPKPPKAPKPPKPPKKPSVDPPKPPKPPKPPQEPSVDPPKPPKPPKA